MTTRSPWMAISILIVGLIVGYSLVVVKGGTDVFANAYRCPLQEENGECAGGCDKGACDGGDCVHCKGCQPSA